MNEIDKNNFNILKDRLLKSESKIEFNEKRKLLRQWVKSKNLKMSEYKQCLKEMRVVAHLFFGNRSIKWSRYEDTEGGVYILHIGLYPDDVVKIGSTTDLQKRIQELDNICVVGGIQVVGWFKTNIPTFIERKVHKILKKYRIQQNREFFKGDISLFKKTIQDTIKEEQEEESHSQ